MSDYNASNDDGFNGPEESGDAREWDSDEALEFLKMERSVMVGESNLELTRRLIEEAAPAAAVSMIHLSQHAMNENTRMNASKWVVEMATQIQTEDGRATWEKVLPEIVNEAERITVSAAGQGEIDNAFEIGD